METIAFARGVPAPDMLPVAELRAAANRAFDSQPAAMLSYGTGGGWPPLQRYLAAQHGVDESQVIVTTGSLEGFGLLASVLAARAAAEHRRARVIVERPTYDRPLLVLERHGIEVVDVPLGPDGVDVEALDRAMAEGADLAYLIPTFQNPAGATLPQAGRDAVVASARRHGVLVLEDDPYRDLHFVQPAPATMFERRGDAPIAFSGSFSKTVAPGLRVGWMVLPHDLAAAVAKLANDTYISSSFLSQATVLAYLEAGAFQPSVDRARGMLAERCALTIAALERSLPDASWAEPGGGYFLWVRLPDGVDVAKASHRATALGVTFVAGACFGSDCEQHARLAFSSPPMDGIGPGMERLARACAESTVTPAR